MMMRYLKVISVDRPPYAWYQRAMNRLADRCAPRWLACILAVVSVGCSHTPVDTYYDSNFDFSKVNHWDWVPEGGELKTPAAVKTADRIRLDNLIRRRVEADLTAKGWIRDRSKAQLFVDWGFGEWPIERSKGAGQHYGAVGLYYPGLHASNTHVGSDGRALPPSADPYGTTRTEARLDLVFVDPRTRKVVWHGDAVDDRDFGYYTSAQTSQISRIVDSMLTSFPPEH